MAGVTGYGSDLAYIHDAAFSGYALQAAPGLLRELRRAGVTRGLVVDLGCGSGRWALELNRARYWVLGIDQSPAFVRLARRRAPKSQFRAGSLYTAPLPACDAVTAIGECFNYTLHGNTGTGSLPRLFARIYRALRPGGLLIFDVATPRRIRGSSPRRQWSQGEDWAVLVETRSVRGGQGLIRKITCFRRSGRRFRRSRETHRLALYQPAEVARWLAEAGFRVRRMSAYGRSRLPAGITAFLARK